MSGLRDTKDIMISYNTLSTVCTRGCLNDSVSIEMRCK